MEDHRHDACTEIDSACSIDAFGSKVDRNNSWTISDWVEAFWWSFAVRILGSTAFHFDRFGKDSRLNSRMDDFSNTTQNWADAFQDHLKYMKSSPEPRGIETEIILYHQSAQSTVSKSYRPPLSKTNLMDRICPSIRKLVKFAAFLVNFEWSNIGYMAAHLSRSFCIINICNLKSIQCT